VARNTGSSEAVLTDLRAQTYPSTRFEIILCEHPSGPSAANRAIDQAAGQIVALTDDQCRIPPGWIEAGVAGMTGWTAAVTGDVLDHSETSRRFFLNLPGRRPSVREEPLYLAANSFYRTDAVRQAGGFDVAFESGQAPGWGWDNQLAYRLASLGYRLGFDEAVYVTRTFPAPRGFEWIADEYRRASEIPIAIRRSPGLSAGFLKGNLFLSPRSLFFDLLVAGVALSAITRRRRYLGLALPWLATTSKYFDAWPPRIWRKSLGTMAEMTARQGIWLVGLIAGSIRARRVVL
jgi:hypothetical protein